MCGSMVDIQSPTAEIRRGNKQEGQHPLTEQRARQFQAGLRGDVGL